MGSHEDFSSDLRLLLSRWRTVLSCRWSNCFLGLQRYTPSWSISSWMIKENPTICIEISMAGWKGDFLATWNMMKHVLDLKQQTGCLFFFSSLTFTLFVSPPPPTWCYLLTRMRVADASVENEMLSVCRMHLDPRHVSVGSITFYYFLLWSWPHFGQWFQHHQPFSADAWV